VHRAHAIYVASFAAIIAFALAFVYPSLSPTRVLWYYPLEHRWAFEIQPSGLAMDWYGRTLLAAGASALVFLASHGVARRVRRASSRFFGLLAGWMITAVVMVMFLYAWQLAHRQPVPAPLPPGYVPR
jgi:hypothetical protein